MTASSPGVLVLDTGALLALERGDERVRAVFRAAVGAGTRILVPGGVLAQSWRGGARQARMATALADPRVEIDALDGLTGRAVGVLCGRSGHPDVVDVHVAMLGRRWRGLIITSDPDDLRDIDPGLTLIEV